MAQNGARPQFLNQLRQRWLTIGDAIRRVIKLLLFIPVVALLTFFLLQFLNVVDFDSAGVTALLSFFIGLLTSATVGILLNYQMSKDLENKFRIISDSEKAGLTSIYRERANAVQAIRELATSRREEDIDILTIAGKDFFRHGGETFRALFEAPLARRQPHRFRILLLHPNSNAAVERSHRELPDDLRERLDNFIATGARSATAKEINDIAPYISRTNCRDVIAAIEDLKRARDICERHDFERAKLRLPDGHFARDQEISRIQVRLYYSTPSFQLLRFDDQVFFEQYHLGRDEAYINETMDNCLAKRMPVFSCIKSSKTGTMLSDHFEYLWARAEPVLDNDHREPNVEKLRAEFGDPDAYVATLAALHIYGSELERFLRPPRARKIGVQAAPASNGSAGRT